MTTIAQPIRKEGIGLHTGEPCAVTLHPAAPGEGVLFVSECGCRIPARAEYVGDTRRGTTLAAEGARIGAVEHVLAALYALEVDAVRIAVEGPEVPACDGSAREWVEAVQEAGIEGKGARRRDRRLGEGVWVREGEAWAVAAPAAGGLSLAVAVDYEGTAAGQQTLWMRLNRRSFVKELAPARTFALADELEALRARGLARGGSAENAFTVGPEGYSGALRFPDEVVRHKALDLVGDLALCGCRFAAHVTALRPSHRLNVALARAIGGALRPDRGSDRTR